MTMSNVPAQFSCMRCCRSSAVAGLGSDNISLKRGLLSKIRMKAFYVDAVTESKGIAKQELMRKKKNNKKCVSGLESSTLWLSG